MFLVVSSGKLKWFTPFEHVPTENHKGCPLFISLYSCYDSQSFCSSHGELAATSFVVLDIACIKRFHVYYYYVEMGVGLYG